MATEREGADDSSLGAVLQSLDEVLKLGGIQAEDAELRFRLVRPLERALVNFTVFPSLPADTPATRIANLLWFKMHPEQTDLESVLRDVQDDDPLVRITATEALLAATQRAQELWTEPTLSRSVRTVLEGQRRDEASPVIRYQLDRLLSEIKKLPRIERSTAPPRPINPYVAGPVIASKDRFFGREDTLRDIRAALREDSGIKSLLLYGARRTGKTSLLYRLQQDALGDDVVAVYVDMQGLAGRTLSSFLSTLVASIERAIKSKKGLGTLRDEISDDKIDLASFQRCVDLALEKIAPSSLLILLDEYEVLKDFIRNADVALQLQSLLQRHQRLFFLFAGSQKVDALKEKNFELLLDNWTSMNISCLKPAETRQLITEPTRGALRFAEGVIEEIHELSGGHPFYTQLLCHDLFDLLQGRGTVTGRTVDQAIQRFLENPPPHLVLGWNALALQQKVVTSTVAEVQGNSNGWVAPGDLITHLRKVSFPIRVGLGEIRQTLGGLRELDWLDKKDRERRFRFSLGLVRRWVEEHRSIWDVLNEYQHNLVERIARLGLRAAATTIDVAVLSGIMLALALGWTIPTWMIPLAVLAYYLASMSAFGRTPGMAIMQLRALTETGVPLQLWRAVLHALLLATPWLLVAAAIPLFDRGRPGLGLTLLSAGLAVAAIQTATVHFSKKGRGMLDQIAHAVVVRR